MFSKSGYGEVDGIGRRYGIERGTGGSRSVMGVAHAAVLDVGAGFFGGVRGAGGYTQGHSLVVVYCCGRVVVVVVATCGCRCKDSHCF